MGRENSFAFAFFGALLGMGLFFLSAGNMIVIGIGGVCCLTSACFLRCGLQKTSREEEQFQALVAGQDMADKQRKAISESLKAMQAQENVTHQVLTQLMEEVDRSRTVQEAHTQVLLDIRKNMEGINAQAASMVQELQGINTLEQNHQQSLSLLQEDGGYLREISTEIHENIPVQMKKWQETMERISLILFDEKKIMEQISKQQRAMFEVIEELPSGNRLEDAASMTTDKICEMVEDKIEDLQESMEENSTKEIVEALDEMIQKQEKFMQLLQNLSQQYAEISQNDMETLKKLCND